MMILVLLRALLTVFWLLLLARSIVELARSFAPDWRPRGILVVLLEVVFTATDPPVKLFRRLIPTTMIGAVRVDVSLTVLMLVVLIALQASW